MGADRHRPDDRTVTVWRIRLNPDDRTAEALRGHLAPDELERLARLHRSEVGRRWLVSRGSLREILAAELGTSPPSVRLKLGPHGRPGFDPETHQTDLDFNLSHSGDVALMATGRGLRVGVDVERLRRGRDPLRVADRYFSAAEVEAPFAPFRRPIARRPSFATGPPRRRWRRGSGSGCRPRSASSSSPRNPGGTMVPVRLARDWRLVELTDLPSGYCGALAVDDDAARIVIRDWPLSAAAS